MSEQLTATIQKIIHSQPGDETWYVGAADSTGQLIVDIGADVAIEEGLSTKKLSLAYALGCSGIDLADTSITLQESDRIGGDGILQYFPVGTELNLQRVAELMLAQSDNAAAKLIVRALKGQVNRLLADNPIPGGLPAGFIKIFEGNKHNPYPFDFGPTTARSSIAYMQAIAKHPVFGPALRHSNFWYGARHNIDPTTARLDHPTPLTLRAVMKAKTNTPAGSALYDELLAADYPESAIATKAGVDGGYRHEVVMFGENGPTIAMLSKGYDPTLPEGPRHPAHRIHSLIGEAVWRAANQV